MIIKEKERVELKYTFKVLSACDTYLEQYHTSTETQAQEDFFGHTLRNGDGHIIAAKDSDGECQLETQVSTVWRWLR